MPLQSRELKILSLEDNRIKIPFPVPRPHAEGVGAGFRQCILLRQFRALDLHDDLPRIAE